MPNRNKAKQLFVKLKQILLSKEGVIGWIIANIITSLHWVVLVVIGFITQNPMWYGYASVAWAVGMSPLLPLWLFNILITIWIYNLLTNKKPRTPKI
jgi:hypothetical protein